MGADRHMLNPDDLKRVVLDTARDMYARQGYVNTTIRGVAAAAGVAPDLVRRYYANREELFAAAMKLPTDPATAVAQLLAPGIDGLAERLVRVTFQLLDEPETREQIAAMVRDGAGAAKSTAPLREFLESVIVDRVAAVLRVPDARMRVALAISYVMGVVGARYVLRMEPLASATEDEVVRLVAPAVQTALAGSA
ncbi:MAG TPA: TetR family transcriptional regulator [Mycobacterium sp.]|nr:MAG: TetR family transcriptional regulator [Mycobacterium sp.]HOB48148.1 TetR family transcriptional regulator [Mycobacterium sp.]HPZ95140.1 TetR family transcriptional regulator [Mycobacterium sp.]HQE14699.1 TetR family transcriptional regulator [Mycobacterium sp.]